MDAEPDPRISLRSQFKGKIVKIKYYDHIEFRRYELNRVSPVLREAVGWLVHEDGEHVIIVFDRPENIVSNGKPSGLCILKSDIVELEEVSEKEGE
ncbi:MAG: hypothetical protein ACP5K8_09240 [Nitrososphaeria archaeon]